MTRVVELCGLPGAGKSTVAGMICDNLRAAGVDCVVADMALSAAAARRARTARRVAAAARVAHRHPRWALSCLQQVYTSQQQSPRDAVAGLAQLLATGHLVCAARAGAGIHLFEEGVTQSLWTLLLRARADVGTRTSWWATIPPGLLSDLVLVVEIPPALADTRLVHRASRHSRTQHLPPAQRRAELARGEQLLHGLLDTCPVPVRTLSVDEDTTRSALAREATRFVLAEV